MGRPAADGRSLIVHSGQARARIPANASVARTTPSTRHFSRPGRSALLPVYEWEGAPRVREVTAVPPELHGDRLRRFHFWGCSIGFPGQPIERLFRDARLELAGGRGVDRAACAGRRSAARRPCLGMVRARSGGGARPVHQAMRPVGCLPFGPNATQPTRQFWRCTWSTGLPSISLVTQSTSVSPLTSNLVERWPFEDPVAIAGRGVAVQVNPGLPDRRLVGVDHRELVPRVHTGYLRAPSPLLGRRRGRKGASRISRSCGPAWIQNRGAPSRGRWALR